LLIRKGDDEFGLKAQGAHHLELPPGENRTLRIVESRTDGAKVYEVFASTLMVVGMLPYLLAFLRTSGIPYLVASDIGYVWSWLRALFRAGTSPKPGCIPS